MLSPFAHFLIPCYCSNNQLIAPLDGTIEEDFEEALAKEVQLAGELGSPETPRLDNRLFPGK